MEDQNDHPGLEQTEGAGTDKILAVLSNGQ
jgi:hypothetical protein